LLTKTILTPRRFVCQGHSHCASKTSPARTQISIQGLQWFEKNSLIRLNITFSSL
jgi:hypothetical protein